ncbi:unnamed protein product [Calypogeia fissa]
MAVAILGGIRGEVKCGGIEKRVAVDGSYLLGTALSGKGNEVSWEFRAIRLRGDWEVAAGHGEDWVMRRAKWKLLQSTGQIG